MRKHGLVTALGLTTMVLAASQVHAQNFTLDFSQPAGTSVTLSAGHYAFSVNGTGFESTGVRMDGFNYRADDGTLLGEHSNVRFNGVSLRSLMDPGSLIGPTPAAGDTYTGGFNLLATTTFAVTRFDAGGAGNGDSGAVNFSFNQNGPAVAAPEGGTMLLVLIGGACVLPFSRRRPA